MVSSELEGRDLKEEESISAYERRIVDLEVELEQLQTEKDADFDRSRAVVAQARTELQNARVWAETAEKSLAKT